MQSQSLSPRFVILFAVCWCSFATPALAQPEERKWVKEGNKLYDQKKFDQAQKKYLDALGKQPNSFRGTFNLGDAYYKQGKYKEATSQFELLTRQNASNDTLAKVYHNLGNSYLQQKEFDKSIQSYKQALKKNNADDETRYNLAYAQKMLKQQQEQQKKDQQDKDKKEQKDDKKNQKEKEKDKDKKEENKNQKEEQAKQNISKEDAERLLQAMNNDEKKLRDKMNEKRAKGAKIQIEKDW